jgi:hypothetical protein
MEDKHFTAYIDLYFFLTFDLYFWRRTELEEAWTSPRQTHSKHSDRRCETSRAVFSFKNEKGGEQCDERHMTITTSPLPSDSRTMKVPDVAHSTGIDTDVRVPLFIPELSTLFISCKSEAVVLFHGSTSCSKRQIRLLGLRSTKFV